MTRQDGRRENELRKIKITPDFTRSAEGSVLIEVGNTRVICNATVEESVPRHVLGTGRGWVTAEYAMLPRATSTRNKRDVSRLKLSPRSAEIQRLIGRALRAVTDLELLGERSVIVDCDVIEADGGTRCASITGGYVALWIALHRLCKAGVLEKMPLRGAVAAVSAGLVEDTALLDLCYVEDSAAQVDMNVVMTDAGEIVELQGTGEERPFTQKELSQIMTLAERGVKKLLSAQAKVIEAYAGKKG